MPTIHRTLGSLRALLAAAAVLLALLPGANAAPGDLFISNVGTDSQNILRVAPDGTSSVFSRADIDGPVGLAFDASGLLYVANNTRNSITRFAPDGTSTEFAISVDGLVGPLGLVVDAAGNVYVANSQANNVIKLPPTGGGAGASSVFFSSNDAVALNRPAGLAIDAAGNVFVANAGGQNIVKITPAGVGSVFVAQGSNGLGIPIALAFGPSGDLFVANNVAGQPGNILRVTPSGQGSVFAPTGVNAPFSIAVDASGNVFVGNGRDNTLTRFNASGGVTPFTVNGLLGAAGLTIQPGGTTPPGNPHPAFFGGEANLGSGAYYLAFASGKPFGYYAFLSDPKYIFHYDLGFEYVFDANDGKSGVYLYDFTSSTFFYTSPSLFPYLYDFSLNAFLYYFPRSQAQAPNVYTSNPRTFFNFATGQIITK